MSRFVTQRLHVGCSVAPCILTARSVHSMPEYTVYLYRSGRVWVHRDAPHKPTDPDPPLLMTTVDAPTQVAALGKLLLQYVDAAKQPYQHIPICIEWCCTLPCDVCAKP